jgi:hypothetical protein
MPGVVPGIHDLGLATNANVDGRDLPARKPSFAPAKAGKPGHDGVVPVEQR